MRLALAFVSRSRVIWVESRIWNRESRRSRRPAPPPGEGSRSWSLPRGGASSRFESRDSRFSSSEPHRPHGVRGAQDEDRVRQGNMDEQPAVQPAMELFLREELPAFLADDLQVVEGFPQL